MRTTTGLPGAGGRLRSLTLAVRLTAGGREWLFKSWSHDLTLPCSNTMAAPTTEAPAWSTAPIEISVYLNDPWDGEDRDWKIVEPELGF
jgi:hypothetical protein